MPVTYWVDQAHKLFCQRWEGRVTQEDVAASRAYAHQQRLSGADRLVDLSQVTGSEVGVQDLSRLAGELKEAVRVAIVAPQPATFGMARMYETLSDLRGSPRRIQVFQTMAEALAWLSAGHSGESAV